MKVRVIFFLLITSNCCNSETWFETFRNGGASVARRLFFQHFQRQINALNGDEFVPTIIGGEAVTSRSATPYMARLSLCSGQYCYHICGAAILTRSHLLTAGHCMFYPRTTTMLPSVSATVGDLNLNVLEESEVQVPVTYTPHPKYDNNKFYFYDIGLAALKGSLIFGNGILPIHLPVPEVDVTGDLALIPGWGRYYGTPGTSVTSATLQFVELKLLSLDACRETYGTAVHQDHLCFGGENSDGGICSGDSGGPVVVFDGDGTAKVVAVNSFIRRTATDDCPTSNPGVGTKIASHLAWIKPILELSAGETPLNVISQASTSQEPTTVQGNKLSFFQEFFVEARMLLSTHEAPSTTPSVTNPPVYPLGTPNCVINEPLYPAQNTPNGVINQSSIQEENFDPGNAEQVTHDVPDASTGKLSFLADFFLEARMLLFPRYYGFRSV
ncbi:unnamed protein product [Notodromas monacha]|uniref:Peptidase S1 domain-containing protein n=1 Tax=Notodromas monacha TaxID=399045 RepID=A0A7R9GAP1_9CRUS|nr:unnamed protein product [Notodromas monacha]CAG0915475.1 unnamed protein product [Notodromas monacha]